MKLSNHSPSALIQAHIEELLVPLNAKLFQALVTMERAKKSGLPPGLVLVVDSENRLKGIITDGDVRRALMQGHTGQVLVEEVMTNSPVFVRADLPWTSILEDVRRQLETRGKLSMVKYPILVDDGQHVIGIVDLSKFMMAQSLHWDRIAVIGLGYVGLTLAVSLAETGFQVVGWESDPSIRSGLQRGVPHIYERGLESLLGTQLADGRLIIANSDDELKNCHVYIVTVSTPLRDQKADLTTLTKAVATMSQHLEAGDLVILRSTVPVGTCGGLVKDTIEATSSLRVGSDVSIAFAPERTVEGRALEELRTLPQIIGGFDQWSLETASRIFSRLTSTVVHMKSLEEAELVKLINNSSRDLSFAFANEIALICEQYNQDAFRVIEAANLGYPRNSVSLPSPGVGGTCLRKDPYFLASLCPAGLPEITSMGRRVNELMPLRVVERVLKALNEVGKPSAETEIFLLGFAFKGEPETSDLRDSATLEIVTLLQKKVRKITGFDPIVTQGAVEALGVEWRTVDQGFGQADAVLFMNNHRDFTKIDIYRLAKTMKRPGVFFDGWHLFNVDEIEKVEGLRYMGLGYLTPWPKDQRS